MIQRLRIKFIILAVIALLLVLVVIVAGMNLLNYNSVVTEADQILNMISSNKGGFPPKDDNRFDVPPHMSPETPYESRFFSVLMTDEGNIIQIETSRIAAVTTSEAKSYGQKVYSTNSRQGFIGNFRYLRSLEHGNIRITFLDCGRSFDSFYSFLRASIFMAFIGFIVILFFVVVFTSLITRPIAESYEKQKRFITDAGHEIKTPLTVINANIDLLEMENTGNPEYINDIKQQTERLKSLTNELIFLSKMEEKENSPIKVTLAFSDIVEETLCLFDGLALSRNQKIHKNIQPALSVNGDHKSLQQLISILTDNALKYSPSDSSINVSLVKQGKSIILTVANQSTVKLDKNSISKVFDRFYRADPSRNSQTGGNGIGLSIAQAITDSHNGKISAKTERGNDFIITVALPAAH